MRISEHAEIYIDAEPLEDWDDETEVPEPVTGIDVWGHAATLWERAPAVYIHVEGDTEHGTVELPTGVHVLRFWTVKVDDPRHPPFRVDVEFIDGRPKVRAVTVLDPPTAIRRALPSELPVGGSYEAHLLDEVLPDRRERDITVEAYRRVPWAAVVRRSLHMAAVTEAGEPAAQAHGRSRRERVLAERDHRRRDGDVTRPFEWPPDERERVAGPAFEEDFYAKWRDIRPRIRQGARLPDAFIQQVADVYLEALRRGDPPTTTVAEVLHGKRPTAAGWVRVARKRGFLDEATPGKAGS